ncbi:MAG: hypothetical protein WCY93_07875 [Anaerolineaceae bacterium]
MELSIGDLVWLYDALEHKIKATDEFLKTTTPEELGTAYVDFLSNQGNRKDLLERLQEELNFE